MDLKKEVSLEQAAARELQYNHGSHLLYDQFTQKYPGMVTQIFQFFCFLLCLIPIKCEYFELEGSKCIRMIIY